MNEMHPETEARLIEHHKSTTQEAINALRKFKLAVVHGEDRAHLLSLCDKEIRELTNLSRTGRRCPANTPEVPR